MHDHRRNPVLLLVLAFVFLLLALGIPYWRADLSSLELSNLIGWPLMLVFIVALATRRAGARFSTAWWVVGSAIPAVVIIRIVVDVAADPTSHNLWPFELVIFGFASFCASLLGVLAGHLALRVGAPPARDKARNS